MLSPSDQIEQLSTKLLVDEAVDRDHGGAVEPAVTQRRAVEHSPLQIGLELAKQDLVRIPLTPLYYFSTTSLSSTRLQGLLWQWFCFLDHSVTEHRVGGLGICCC